jgi:exodeoxyribonuclease V gamma subunit
MLAQRTATDTVTVSFNLYYGNDAEALIEQLAQRLHAPVGAGNLLAPELILVPQFGLRRWLEIRLAEKCGILANVDFFAPAEYAWRLLRAENPELAETSLFDRKLLRWRIFAQLAELAREPRFSALAHALADREPSTRLRLADELAQVFERHLAYRSDLLAQWQRGDARSDWQAELWRRLVRGAGEPHRAQLLGDYIRRHDATVAAPPGLPARLFAFACTNISPDLLRFYGVVAQHCELDFLMPNPCREYWGDVRAEKERLRELGTEAFDADENPLLAGYGRAGREFVGQLFSYEQVQPAIELDLSRERGRDTLLHRLQTDVLNRAAPNPEQVGEPDDTSLQFHICHSRLREVQVLHDQLVDLFQRDATLTARDVAIMAPDIAAYAPYVHAVFGGVARDDARYLPYTLSDCSARDSHALIVFALKLIALPLSRMGLDEVIELFATPAAMRKLGLDGRQLDQLASWLREAGVRWGIDEAQHEALGAGCYREFSWEFGLDRLLLGYASGGTDALLAGIAPAQSIEGSGAQTLGALLPAFDALKALLRVQRQTHTPAQWQQIYNAAFDALLDVDRDDRGEVHALASIRAALAALAEDAAAAAVEEPLDWQCVRDFLSARLTEPERSYRFFSGGISVCGMLPLRVVPFRVICLIGMNDEAFPRRDRVSALDRAPAEASARRTSADRSDRDDDRYLFLQLLTSVRDVFYLSWIGEEQRDGSAREPSAVVAELLDVASKEYFPDAQKALAALVVKHPLQPFSPRYFDASDARVFTYREQWRSAAASAVGAQALPAFVDTPLVQDDNDQGRRPLLSLDALQQFWRNPARAFFSDRLGLRLPRREDERDDSDPLEADGLLRYQLLDALIRSERTLEQPPTPSAADDAAFWRAHALLPVGSAGAAELADARVPARALAHALRDLQGAIAPSLPAPFALELPSGASLVGALPEHRDGLICRSSAGAVRGSRLLQAWIDYLVLAAQHPRACLILLAWDKDTLQTHTLRGIDNAQAKSQLDMLLSWQRAGQLRPLLFFPRTSQEYVERLRKSAGQDERVASAAPDADALEHARRIFVGTSAKQGGLESADTAYALAMRGVDLFAESSSAAADFAELARAIYAPVLATLGDSA